MIGNCPHCGALGEPGKPCPACGRRIPTAAHEAARRRILWAVAHPRLAKWAVALRVGGPAPWGILRAYWVLWIAPPRDVLAEWLDEVD